ncbi:MAG: GerMN domain-containing protein [Spirochaetota bacterium]
MATTKKRNSAKTSKSTAKKNISSKKKRLAASSNAPYVLVIMALAAGLIFLLSVKTDTVKHIVSKNDTVVEGNKSNNSTNDVSKYSKTVDSRKDFDSKEKHKQGLSHKEKKKEDEAALVQAKVYFLYYNERADKIELRPVVRDVNAKVPVKAVLEELIKGPTPLEEKKGYVTAIPPKLKVIDVSIVNNIAFINFNGALEEGAAGNIMLNRLDQIVYTATQFSNVDGIHILINGQRKRFLGPDGISIAGPLKRH